MGVPMVSAAQAAAAGDSNPYSRRNTFAVFAEYSNDSSHIVLGVSPNRKIGAIGAMYERRLIASRYVAWSYVATFRPFIVNSDPSANVTQTISINGMNFGSVTASGVVLQCFAGTQTSAVPGGGGVETMTDVTTCTRQNTLAQGASPVGFRLNFIPRRPLQLTVSSNVGYIFATKPIPVPNAGAFNFTFEFGAGLEYFYKAHKSIRLEYVVQHYSNAYTATSNPGVDSGFVKLTYGFGK